jgi:hypothetical protein
MKNVTITPRDDLARRARVEAARQDKSLSRFVADLLEQRCPAERPDKLALLRKFLDGPGYPGISKAWRGREALYAEREDELLRRYESSRFRGRSGRADKAAAGKGFSSANHQAPYTVAESAKPQRALSRRDRKTRPHAKK